jgi:hypothetical protein
MSNPEGAGRGRDERGQDVNVEKTFIIKLKYRSVSTVFYRSILIVIMEGERNRL